MMIDPTHRALSIRRQCELLGLNRSSFYYQPATETEMKDLSQNNLSDFML